LSIASSVTHAPSHTDSDESRQLTLLVQRDIDGRHSVTYQGRVIDCDTPQALASHAHDAIIEHLTRSLRPTH
jgi:hypothetical protein